MQFIQDNFIWFIVGGVVILMAIIGYFADKTDFGRKKEDSSEPKPKKEKKQKKIKEPKPDKIEVEAKGIGELTQEITDQLKVDATQTTQEAPVSEDLYAPLNNETTPINNEVIDESLYAPLTNEQTNLDNTSFDIPVEPVAETEDNAETSVEIAPEQDNLEVSNDDVTVVNEDEDIWKF